jgi:predicted LPLAT superfamily acyltransferase
MTGRGVEIPRDRLGHHARQTPYNGFNFHASWS